MSTRCASGREASTSARTKPELSASCWMSGRLSSPICARRQGAGQRREIRQFLGSREGCRTGEGEHGRETLLHSAAEGDQGPLFPSQPQGARTSSLPFPDCSQLIILGGRWEGEGGRNGGKWWGGRRCVGWDMKSRKGPNQSSGVRSSELRRSLVMILRDIVPLLSSAAGHCRRAPISLLI